MRKGNDLIGLSIYTRDKGKEIDTVRNVVFDYKANRILGLIVDEGGWFSDATAISWSNISAVGPDGLIIRGSEVVEDAEEHPRLKGILEEGNTLGGTQVMTVSGKDLGTIKDFYFDDKTGLIEGYEVSGGVFADAYTGRSFMPAPELFDIGEDVAFVPDRVALLMEEQVDGLKGAVQSVGDSLKENANKAGEKISELSSSASEKASELSDKSSQKLSELSAKASDLGSQTGEKLSEVQARAAEEWENTKSKASDKISEVSDSTQGSVASAGLEQARGRRVRTPVYASSSKLVYVADVGQIVTDRVVQRAELYEKEQELLAAVGLAPADAAGAQIKHSAEGAAATAKEKASDLWDGVKKVAGGVQESVSGTVEQKRIEAALGKPVTRVILDNEDNVILNVGDLITHQAVKEAREANVLNILLNSAYSEKPDLSVEERRAPQKGSAALDS